MNFDEIIEFLNDRRIEMQITYKRLTLMTNMSESNLDKLFKGKLNLGLANLLKICEALGVEVKLEKDMTMVPFKIKRKDMWQRNIDNQNKKIKNKIQNNNSEKGQTVDE